MLDAIWQDAEARKGPMRQGSGHSRKSAANSPCKIAELKKQEGGRFYINNSAVTFKELLSNEDDEIFQQAMESIVTLFVFVLFYCSIFYCIFCCH